MIFGIGTDITKISRFEKWVTNPEMMSRFFNEKEYSESGTVAARCEHAAARFAAKEAFSKALGTGLCGFSLKEVYVSNDKNGKPLLNVEGAALELLKKKCGECSIHLSLSHEKEYAVAFVVIECL